MKEFRRKHLRELTKERAELSNCRWIMLRKLAQGDIKEGDAEVKKVRLQAQRHQLNIDKILEPYRVYRETLMKLGVGWDFIDEDDKPFDYTAKGGVFPGENHDHGTHLAGTAIQYSEDIALLPVRNDSRHLLEAARYTADRGVRVIVSSQGTNQSFHFWRDLWMAATEFPNIIFVVSAGNEIQDLNSNILLLDLAKLDNVLIVGSVDENQKLSWFSNTGNRVIHIAAVGEDINSTVPHGEMKEASGTSMAAPKVGNLCARIIFKRPDLTPGKVRDILKSTVTITAELKSLFIFQGAINGEAALKSVDKLTP